MKPSLLLLSLLIPLSACAFSPKKPVTPEPTPSVTVTPAPSETPTPVPSVSPSPGPELAYKGEMISIRKIVGASAKEVDMIKAGAKLANDMLKKPCFKQWVQAADYTEDNGLSQVQIFNLITTTPMTVDVEMYTGTWSQNHVSKTVGWEADPFDGWVHMNRYFVNSAYMVGDNLIHEDRGHSLEFHHFNVKATSEPYGMNYAYEGCYQAQQMQAKGGKDYRPPGIRLEVRYKDGTRKVHPGRKKATEPRRHKVPKGDKQTA